MAMENNFRNSKIYLDLQYKPFLFAKPAGEW